MMNKKHIPQLERRQHRALAQIHNMEVAHTSMHTIAATIDDTGVSLTSSSPPTPPSPLPISHGPGNQRYYFSPSQSSSPPFSSPPSSHASAENLPLLQGTTVSPFSLDHQHRPDDDPALEEKSSSCLKDLLEWFIQRCCNCCSKSSPTPSPDFFKL